MKTNYFDEHGNYINVENLSLAEIYQRGYEKGREDEWKIAIKEIARGREE